MDYALKLTAGVVINGEARVAGEVVHVDKSLARNLLDRRRAVLAAEADLPEPEPAPEPDADPKPKARGKAAPADADKEPSE